MKKLFYFLYCFAFAFACTQAKKPISDSGLNNGCNPLPPDTAYLALSTDSASAWISRYKEVNPTAVQYFTLNATDLWEVMGLQRPKTCSHYPKAHIAFGLDVSKTLHLLITPADSSGRSIQLKGKYTGLARNLSKAGSTDLKNGSYVLDFSSPCPPTCPD